MKRALQFHRVPKGLIEKSKAPHPCDRKINPGTHCFIKILVHGPRIKPQEEVCTCSSNETLSRRLKKEAGAEKGRLQRRANRF